MTSTRELSSASYADTKPHYQILDGLRGTAALVVVVYHIFEAFATSHIDQTINHGYLAVDFFFMLSGFVLSYAYDDRWGKMSIRDFVLRRFVRLHPMVVLGAVLGGALFYLQGCPVWDVSVVTIGSLLIAVLLNALMIPATMQHEVRGLGEMYPLNGPTWSLFFEYLGSLLYAFVLRKLSTRALKVFVTLAAIGLTVFAITGPLGNLVAGWAMDVPNVIGGSLRVTFALSMGLLLARLFRKPIEVRGAFWICSLIIVVLLSMPHIGGEAFGWVNGLYDAICAVLIFPVLVYMGASARVQGERMGRVYRWLGDISYPLYLVHYPFIYIYYAWVKNEELTFVQSLPGALALFFGSILLAQLCLKLYDIPVRRYLTKRFISRAK